MIRLPPALYGPFRLLAGGSTLFVFYTSLVFLLEPRPDEAARIYDYAVLIGFEFIFNPLAMLLHATRRSPVGTLAVLAFFSGFVLSFGALMIEPRTMAWLIAALLVGHLLPRPPPSIDDEQEAMGCFAGRIMLYFTVLVACTVLSPVLPEAGLNEAWIAASGYRDLQAHGGLILDRPHVAVWIGVLYFGALLAWQAYMAYYRNAYPTREARDRAERRLQSRLDRWSARIEAWSERRGRGR